MTGHSLTVRPCNSNLILFGGLSPVKLHLGKFRKAQSQNYHEHYLYAWSEELGWTMIGPRSRDSPATPCRRSGHSAIVTNDKLYIFGGIDAYHNALSDLWEYDLDRGSWRGISNFHEVVSPCAFGSGFLSQGWWILIGKEPHAKSTQIFSVENSNEKLRVQAYSIANETWATELSVEQNLLDSHFPMPYFFAPPKEYMEKQCRHLQELNFAFDNTCVPLHALSIFCTQAEKLNTALIHVTGSIKQHDTNPWTSPPSSLGTTEFHPAHTMPNKSSDNNGQRAEKQVKEGQRNSKSCGKRKLTNHQLKNSKQRKNKVAGVECNSQDEIFNQATDISEFMSWTKFNFEPCKTESGWLHQFASTVPMEGMNMFMLESVL